MHVYIHTPQCVKGAGFWFCTTVSKDPLHIDAKGYGGRIQLTKTDATLIKNRPKGGSVHTRLNRALRFPLGVVSYASKHVRVSILTEISLSTIAPYSKTALVYSYSHDPVALYMIVLFPVSRHSCLFPETFSF